MGRTIHYRTREPVSESEFERLKETASSLNSEVSWELEGLKLWRGQGLTVEGQAWGFIKIKSEEEAELSLESLKEMSSEVPRLTWIVYDEGGDEGRELHLKDGNFFSPG